VVYIGMVLRSHLVVDAVDGRRHLRRRIASIRLEINRHDIFALGSLVLDNRRHCRNGAGKELGSIVC
jgi:hypothetical protein